MAGWLNVPMYLFYVHKKCQIHMHYSIWSDAEKREKKGGGGNRTAVASALLLVYQGMSAVIRHGGRMNSVAPLKLCDQMTVDYLGKLLVLTRNHQRGK